MCWLLISLTMFAAQARTPKPFKPVDGTFAMSIPASFRRLTGAALQDYWLCTRSALACFEYVAAKGENADRSLDAALEVRTVSGKNEGSCSSADFITNNKGDQIPALLESSLSMSKSKWIHGHMESAGGGSLLTGDFYQSWHAGNCWVISLYRYTRIMEPPPDGVLIEQQISQQLDASLRSFHFLP